MRNRNYTILAVVAMSAVFGGCFAWNYVKEGYDNFSAYFNTYYNASLDFDAALKDVKDARRAYELSVIAGDHPAPFAVSQKARDEFNGVIVGASKVLQYHPHSAFTEDCLFMIGIAYYYQDDNIRGERKFMEIESTFPRSKRYAEAEMYYGGLQLEGLEGTAGMNRVYNAIDIARREKDRKIVATSCEILANYYLRQEDTLSAAEYLDTASTYSSGDDAAIYACRAGDLFTDAGNIAKAEKEFSTAAGAARDVQIRFYSIYYCARTQRLLHRYYLALNQLANLRGDDKYFDFFPLIEYQRAAVMYDSGEVSTAVTNLERIDTAYASNVAATRSAYLLGNIYLRLVGDFQAALKYYQRVGSHPVVYSASDKGKQMASALQNYLMLGYRVQLSDSLYRRAVEAVDQKDTTANYTQENLDSLYEHAADARDELGGLFMFQLQMPDSALHEYKIVVKEFPRSKVYASVLYSLGEYYYSRGDSAEGRAYLEELIRKHSESQYASSACSVLGISPPDVESRSHAIYSEAMALVDSGHYHEAVDSLKFLALDKKSSIAPQALYTTGWVFETKLEKPDSAYAYYKRLSTEFPLSDFTKHVALAVTGYETAQRDSAMAKKMREDSVAAASRQKELQADSLSRAPKEQPVQSPTLRPAPEPGPDSSRTLIKTPPEAPGVVKDSSGEAVRRRE